MGICIWTPRGITQFGIRTFKALIDGLEAAETNTIDIIELCDLLEDGQNRFIQAKVNNLSHRIRTNFVRTGPGVKQGSDIISTIPWDFKTALRQLNSHDKS